MRIPREAWWIMALAVIVVAVALAFSGNEREPRQDWLVNRTSYSSRADGLRIFYLTLRELGYDARRMRTPFTARTLPAHGTLVIADPTLPVAGSEDRALLAWVRAGGAVVWADESSMPQIETPLGEGILAAPKVTYARARQPSYLARRCRRLAVRTERRLDAPDFAAAPDRRASGPRVSRDDEWGTALAAAIPVYRDQHGTVVASARLGAGRVVLLSSPWSLSNEGIRRADNLEFALNAVGAPRGRSVHFDEYHHGYGESATWSLTPWALKLALAQLLIGLLVVMLARSRRFGAVRPLDRGRRERSEFLGTMTALLRKAHAARLGLRTAVDAAAAQLRVELGLPAQADDAAIIAAARRVNPEGGRKLEAALRRSAGALQGGEPVAEGRAVALVRELDDAVRSLHEIDRGKKR